MRIGIDLGGTKTEAIALDRDGAVLERLRVASGTDYEATLVTIRDLVAEVERRTGRRGTIGIGMPGAISPASGLVKNANSTWLIGRPLDRDLAAVLERPVRLANDADCFALSEARDGAAAGARVVFGVILGTGVGGGIVVDGRLVGGPNAIAGEWGHVPLPWPQDDERPGPQCYCGRRGCIETFLSGPALARDDGRGLEAAAIAADPGAPALVRYRHRLARGLAQIVTLLDPNVIVLGGGLSQIASLYTEVPALWGEWVFSDTVATRLVPPKHGDSSGVRGAAWLWGVDDTDPS
jgi:fructokinase